MGQNLAMTPEAQERFLNQPDRPWGWNYSPTGSELLGQTVRQSLIEMAKHGVKQVAAGHYDGLRFDVFNIAEANFLKAYMGERHPDVPFGTTRLV